MAKAKAEAKPPKSIFTLDEMNRKKLKVAAAITGKDMQGIVNEALAEWFERYEKKNGPVPVK